MFASPLLTAAPVNFALVQEISTHVGDRRVMDLCRQLPPAIAADAATLRRLSNVIEPVDAGGTRGSYAGWITRSALAACAARADAANFASLLLFFHRGGSIRELERIAARVLPPIPGTSEPAPFLGGLIAMVDPLGGWRDHRRAMLSASNDPLHALKIKEVNDRSMRLSAGEATPEMKRGQRTAYLADVDVDRLTQAIQEEASLWMEERDAERRYGKTKETVASVLTDPKVPYDRLWVPQIRIALKLLGDDLSTDVAGRINREYRLRPCTLDDFDHNVRKRHHLEKITRFKDPKTQRAIYFKESARCGAELYVQCQPPDLPWNLDPTDILLEVLANVVHDDDHHVQLHKRNYGGRREEKFALELHGHGVEYLWRARHGDPGLLRSLTIENPLGSALAFRDYFEKYY